MSDQKSTAPSGNDAEFQHQVGASFRLRCTPASSSGFQSSTNAKGLCRAGTFPTHSPSTSPAFLAVTLSSTQEEVGGVATAEPAVAPFSAAPLRRRCHPTWTQGQPVGAEGKVLLHSLPRVQGPFLRRFPIVPMEWGLR